MGKMNSKEYWNSRFSTDWVLYDGNEQTEFFANTLYEMLPEWLQKEICINKYSICDLGCAEGDALKIYRQFFSHSEIVGEDFSEIAIKKANEKYPEFQYKVSDILKPEAEKKYQVVICSNVVEHFKETYKVLECILERSEKYAIVMLPYREELGKIDEHEKSFSCKDFPMQIGEHHLIFAKSRECKSSYYPYEQILLVYAKERKNTYLSDIIENVSNTGQLRSEKELELCKQENEKKVLEINLSKQKIEEKDTEISLYKQRIEEKDTEISLYKQKIEEKDTEIKRFEEKIENINNEIKNKNQIISASINECVRLIESKTFKLLHFLYRTRYQGLNSNKEEKKKYRKWLASKIRGNGGDSDHRFNPIYPIIDILRGNVQQTDLLMDTLSHDILNSPLGSHLYAEAQKLRDFNYDEKQVSAIREILQNRDYKGIIVYPHVVYWEPLQTPQQLLKAFARKGWLCFFCEHPAVEDAFREVEPNVVIVYEKEFLRAIGEKEVTVLLTWLGSSSFVSEIKNKKIWYHILDKLTLFPYYDKSYEILHDRYVDCADFVSYVATPLLDCLGNKVNTIYLPNGVNPEEFLNIHNSYVPEDMKSIISTGHKIIGYYGYLAEWMDYDMVRAAALARPEYEFVFIGKAICDISKLEGISNIHLLGLKPYQELSDYAKFFDVATIPFVINDKMDCVSPIKFYEYCALGLPVVTSKMKEMETLVNDYVACVDGLEEFLFYIDKFSEDKIKKIAAEKAMLIARSNTWLARVEKMEDAFNKSLDVILEQKYSKFDVIILGVIDYDFRFQRPQHFAVRFAQNGHRVFYINANHYNPKSIIKIEENLFVINIYNSETSSIHLTDWKNQSLELNSQLDEIMNQYCIRDAITIVDYPNWIYAADYLRTAYGFKILTDYMDDYTGFLNPSEDLVKENCLKLLKMSDAVVSSSQFLYEIAIKYNNNVSIIRNGTEFNHFYQAYSPKKNKKKIIGYYGAIAEWFEADKVIYVAKHLPDCEVALIGQVTKWKKELSSCSNIKLYGEKPYNELPEYLTDFDVCLIPFDTSTDLIKATNPVKFYEYLSAGKKIVATEIPELEPYRDRYVYMANDNEQFLEYVKLCIEEKDSLENTESCISFAKENDWQMRYNAFVNACKLSVPKVSVVVLTYNNLNINKICIESILSKTAYANYELIIVDNCSTDGTREYLESMEKIDSRIKVVLNNQNKGFAAGNNDGLQIADGEYVVLLNNDTIVTRGWLTAMTKHMENEKKLGMCGPVTNSIGNEAKIKVDYHSTKELNRFAYCYTTDHLNEQYSNINVLALFCTMIKREVITKCGFLDEQYGIGMFEDDDYAEATKKAGFRLTIAEDAFVHHFESVSFKKLEDEEFQKLFTENKRKFETKWGKAWKMHKKRPGIEWNTNADVNILE